MAATAASTEPWAVSRMTAISSVLCDSLRAEPRPSMRGILRSVTTMPGLPGLNLLEAFDAIARGFGAIAPGGDELGEPGSVRALRLRRSGLFLAPFGIRPLIRPCPHKSAAQTSEDTLMLIIYLMQKAGLSRISSRHLPDGPERTRARAESSQSTSAGQEMLTMCE